MEDEEDRPLYYDFPAPCSFGFHHKGMRGYYIATLRAYSDDTSVICYGHHDIFNTRKEAQSFLRERKKDDPVYARSKHILIDPSKSAKFMGIILKLKCGV